MKRQAKESLKKEGLEKLRKVLGEKKAELAKLIAKKEQERNFAVIGKKRQEIAIISTIIKEKEFEKGTE